MNIIKDLFDDHGNMFFNQKNIDILDSAHNCIEKRAITIFQLYQKHELFPSAKWEGGHYIPVIDSVVFRNFDNNKVYFDCTEYGRMGGSDENWIEAIPIEHIFDDCNIQFVLKNLRAEKEKQLETIKNNKKECEEKAVREKELKLLFQLQEKYNKQ